MIALIFFVITLVLLTLALTSPFEVLTATKMRFRKADKKMPASITSVVIYLSGIGSITGTELLPDETEYLTLLKKNKSVYLITDVFPYSMNNTGLNGQRLMGKFWNWVSEWRDSDSTFFAGLITSLVNIRNLFQVLVSADYRYGPLYDAGSARVIMDALLRHGWNGTTPVAIIGYSGGAQIATSAVRYLSRYVHAPISVVSVGGAIFSDAGVPYLTKLSRIHGSKDFLMRIMPYISIIYWPFVHSRWNLALKSGHISTTVINEIVHNGPHGYFGKKVTYVARATSKAIVK